MAPATVSRHAARRAAKKTMIGAKRPHMQLRIRPQRYIRTGSSSSENINRNSGGLVAASGESTIPRTPKSDNGCRIEVSSELGPGGQTCDADPDAEGESRHEEHGADDPRRPRLPPPGGAPERRRPEAITGWRIAF